MPAITTDGLCLPTHGSAGLEGEAPPGSLVDLVYQDEEDRVTRRRVEIVSWSQARNGFTCLREEERMFRGDRIPAWRVVARNGPALSRPAVVFVPIEPPRFRAWTVENDGILGGYAVEAGMYVPVDHEKVGDLTNAVGDGWRLRAIWEPEGLYGEQM